MAVLDHLHDAVVIRVVYDGPPFAGKTTSVRALAVGLGGRVVAPEEVSGRTLYFDWLDYTGGLFEGRRIRCQIITVPGQATLASRRRHLLQSADVVVFVGDSSPKEQSATSSYLTGLRNVLEKLDGPPVGIVLQANKRDQPSAVSLDSLHAMVDRIGGRIGIVESVATDGTGIREAFVFAVRLALDRVRELMRQGCLQAAAPEIDSADDLLAQLRRKEGESLALAAQTNLAHTRLHELSGSTSLAEQVLQQTLEDHDAQPSREHRASDVRVSGTRNSEPLMPGMNAHAATIASSTPRNDPSTRELPPKIPADNLPSGRIWPAVSGRLILHQATSRPVSLKRLVNGDWVGRGGDAWLMRSSASDLFTDFDYSHATLVNWARVHAACLDVVTGERCILLEDEGGGKFRLWQVVRRVASLRDQLDRALDEGGNAVADQLIALVCAFVQAARQLAVAPCSLPLSLKSICAIPDAGIRYCSYLPSPLQVKAAETWPEPGLFKLLAMQLEYARPELAALKNTVLQTLDRAPKATHSIGDNCVDRFIRQFLDVTEP